MTKFMPTIKKTIVNLNLTLFTLHYFVSITKMLISSAVPTQNIKTKQAGSEAHYISRHYKKHTRNNWEKV